MRLSPTETAKRRILGEKSVEQIKCKVHAVRFYESISLTWFLSYNK